MIQISAYGRLTRDPVEIITRNNKQMCTSTIACHASGFNDTEEKTIFYSITAFNFLALDLAKHKQGDLLSVSGVVTLNDWEKDGKKYSSHQILVNSIVSSRTVRPYTGRKKKTAQKKQSG